MTVLVVVLVAGVLLTVLAALVREIRRDAYGLRPPPRSRQDEAEENWVQLTRLSRLG